MPKKKLLTFLFCIWSISLAQCGDGDSLSKKIDFKVTPDSPIVINADITLFPGTDRETKVSAPWFRMSFDVTNKTEDHSLVFVTARLEVPGSAYEYILNADSSCDSDSESRPEIVILSPTPGNNRFVGADYTGANACDATDYDSLIPERWYIGGLPDRGDFFSYGLTMEALGWFEDADGVPTERFSKITSFITR